MIGTMEKKVAALLSTTYPVSEFKGAKQTLTAEHISLVPRYTCRGSGYHYKRPWRDSRLNRSTLILVYEVHTTDEHVDAQLQNPL